MPDPTNTTYTIPKAGKSHSCDKCGGEIQKGERYVHIATFKRTEYTRKVYDSHVCREHRVCPVGFQKLTDEKLIDLWELTHKFEAPSDTELTELRTLVSALLPKSNEVGDEYHTMAELYDYRMLYNALSAMFMPRAIVCKSWHHSDGELCFGGGWFIVVMMLPTGQVSNHYKAEHWPLFHVPEVDRPPAYDGHTPAIAAERMRDLLKGKTE